MIEVMIIWKFLNIFLYPKKFWNTLQLRHQSSDSIFLSIFLNFLDSEIFIANSSVKTHFKIKFCDWGDDHFKILNACNKKRKDWKKLKKNPVYTFHWYWVNKIFYPSNFQLPKLIRTVFTAVWKSWRNFGKSAAGSSIAGIG